MDNRCLLHNSSSEPESSTLCSGLPHVIDPQPQDGRDLRLFDLHLHRLVANTLLCTYFRYGFQQRKLWFQLVAVGVTLPSACFWINAFWGRDCCIHPYSCLKMGPLYTDLRYAICTHCILSICNIYLFPVLILRAGFAFCLLQFLFIAFLLLFNASCVGGRLSGSFPLLNKNILIWPICVISTSS